MNLIHKNVSTLTVSKLGWWVFWGFIILFPLFTCKSGTFNNKKQKRKASILSNNHIPHSVLSYPCYPGEFWSNVCLAE